MGLETARHPKLLELEREVGRFCFDMWRRPESGRLLVLAGDNGTAKTRCAKAVRRWVTAVGHGKQYVVRAGEVRHLDAVYWDWPALLDTMKNGQWDVLADCFETTCLIVDELGGGHDPSRVGTDKLCQILGRREHKWTLVTTNVLPEAFETMFDRRIASRMLRNSILVSLYDVPDFNT